MNLKTIMTKILLPETFNLKFFNIIRQDNMLIDVFDYKFRSKENIEDYLKEFDGEVEESIVRNTNWLYKGDGYLPLILGIYKDNIIAINEDFFLIKFCDYFQDIPFEIYRRAFDSYNHKHLNKLNEYQKWCEDNNIVVDPNNYYHDENGDIFKEYFELDYDQDIIGLY